MKKRLLTLLAMLLFAQGVFAVMTIRKFLSDYVAVYKKSPNPANRTKLISAFDELKGADIRRGRDAISNQLGTTIETLRAAAAKPTPPPIIPPKKPTPTPKPVVTPVPVVPVPPVITPAPPPVITPIPVIPTPPPPPTPTPVVPTPPVVIPTPPPPPGVDDYAMLKGKVDNFESKVKAAVTDLNDRIDQAVKLDDLTKMKDELNKVNQEIKDIRQEGLALVKAIADSHTAGRLSASDKAKLDKDMDDIGKLGATVKLKDLQDEIKLTDEVVKLDAADKLLKQEVNKLKVETAKATPDTTKLQAGISKVKAQLQKVKDKLAEIKASAEYAALPPASLAKMDVDAFTIDETAANDAINAAQAKIAVPTPTPVPVVDKATDVDIKLGDTDANRFVSFKVGAKPYKAQSNEDADDTIEADNATFATDINTLSKTIFEELGKAIATEATKSPDAKTNDLAIRRVGSIFLQAYESLKDPITGIDKPGFDQARENIRELVKPAFDQYSDATVGIIKNLKSEFGL